MFLLCGGAQVIFPLSLIFLLLFVCFFLFVLIECVLLVLNFLYLGLDKKLPNSSNMKPSVLN